MSPSDRESLLRRIRQIRRAATPPAEQTAEGQHDPLVDPLQGLEARLAHVEQLLEGLQDSVHRESERQAEQIASLQAKVDPVAMRAALAEDARKRGL
jgi:uncharacterized coiled-coil protein SlyX